MNKKIVLLGLLLFCSTELYSSHTTETTDLILIVIEPAQNEIKENNLSPFEVNVSSQTVLLKDAEVKDKGVKGETGSK